MGRKTTVEFLDEVNETVMEVRGKLIKHTKKEVTQSKVVNMLLFIFTIPHDSIKETKERYKEQFGNIGEIFTEMELEPILEKLNRELSEGENNE